MKSKIIVLFFILICQFNYGQTKKHYKYDVLNRLISVSDNGSEITYAYDELGNRTCKKVVKIQSDILKISDYKLFIYPNPVKDILYVKMELSEDIHYSIYSFAGVIVSEGDLSFSKKNINVTNLVRGTYILQITLDNSTYNQLFIKD